MQEHALQEVIDIEASSRQNPVQTAAIACVQPLKVSLLPTLLQTREDLIIRKNVLFGCEAIAAAKLDMLLNGVIAHRIQALQDLPQQYPDISEKYAYFDFDSALRWRDDRGYPMLAIYCLDNSNCNFELGWERRRLSSRESITRGFINPEPPAPIRACFNDVLALLHNKCSGVMGIESITSCFRGLIPAVCRADIIKAKKYFDKIFVIAQAEWIERINTDPLVVGYKDGYAWLIAAFDLTPFEADIVNFFTRKLV
ncbi:MAG: hypothetical protein HYT62_04275 [Candidatus Yanofskybacteria bacterium]|nr:hypothetical protein [Candidatus Yanofskybacteria bacterium]